MRARNFRGTSLILTFAKNGKKRKRAFGQSPHAPKARSAFLKFNMFLCLWMRVGKNKLTPMIYKSKGQDEKERVSYWAERLKKGELFDHC